MQLPLIPVSILDRAPLRQGSAAADALSATLERAHRAEELGYHRFWVAEHHAVPGIAGSAPTVLMAAIAARTQRIRVGSGGVMLPNHQPVVVAEQIATLQALFPGRIDLGIGRSVGFTPAVRAALRQGSDAADRFEEDLTELLSYLQGSAPITARPPDRGATPPFVLATGKGAEYAARAGLAVVLGGPAFTGRKSARAQSMLDSYRQSFQPSDYYTEPYVIIAANVAVAASAEEARDLLVPEAWAMTAARTVGDFPPLESVATIRGRQLTSRQHTILDETLAATVHGTADAVAADLERLLKVTGADELMVTTNSFDRSALAESDRKLAALLRL